MLRKRHMLRIASLIATALVATACSAHTAAPATSVASAATGTPSTANVLVETPQSVVTPTQSVDPQATCELLRSVTSVAGASSATVVAAFETDEAGLQRLWGRLLQDPSVGSIGYDPQATPLSAEAAAVPVLVCYLDGNMVMGPAPGSQDGGSGAVRLVTSLGPDHVVRPLVSGPPETIPILDPNELPD